MSMTTGRFGGQCLALADSTGSTEAVRKQLTSSMVNFSWGFAYKQDSLSAIGNQPFAYVLDSANGVQLSLYIASTGVVTLYRGNGATAIITSAVGVIALSTWAYIELFGKIDGTTGTAELWINGVQIGTFSGNTLATANVNMQGIEFAAPDASGSGNNAYFDDVFLTDTAARVGERRIETLRPAADNTAIWVPNSGVTNFSRVNETTVDGDTSYVSSSNVGDKDLYTLSALSSTPASIDAVNVVSFAEKTDATTRTLFNSVQSAGTNSDGSAFALAASYGRFDRLIQTDPNGGGAWTASRVNGLFIGPKVAS
jgi:hypothetical protein